MDLIEPTMGFIGAGMVTVTFSVLLWYLFCWLVKAAGKGFFAQNVGLDVCVRLFENHQDRIKSLEDRYEQVLGKKPSQLKRVPRKPTETSGARH